MKENNLNVDDCNSLSSKISLLSNFATGTKDLIKFYNELGVYLQLYGI
jgi:hypothetical protein